MRCLGQFCDVEISKQLKTSQEVYHHICSRNYMTSYILFIQKCCGDAKQNAVVMGISVPALGLGFNPIHPVRAPHKTIATCYNNYPYRIIKM